MDRELVLLVLIPALVGPILCVAGLWHGRNGESACAQLSERRRWRDLWIPFLPAAVLLALLIGWATVEPERAEAARGTVLASAALFGLVWMRAASRAVWALLHRPHDVPASTVGFFRPRVHLSQRFVDNLDADAIAAARAHEEAHARHRDPLRLWLAQFATDLQWPTTATHGRLLAWHRMLELARDEEARRLGTRGEDLAAAIIAAAKLQSDAPRLDAAGLLGNGSRLHERVCRALAPLSLPPGEDRGWPPRLVALGILLFAASALGALVGESLVRAILR